MLNCIISMRDMGDLLWPSLGPLLCTTLLNCHQIAAILLPLAVGAAFGDTWRQNPLAQELMIIIDLPDVPINIHSKGRVYFTPFFVTPHHLPPSGVRSISSPAATTTMTSRGDADPPASDTRTTRSSAPRMPQTPTTTPPDPSDLPPETPKGPRDLVTEIRALLSHAQITKRKMSEAAYKDCFSLLDALNTSLDDKDILSSSLDAFKVDLLSQIQTTITRSCPAPAYATIAATPARPSPAHTPVAPSPPIAKRTEFVIALDKKNELLALPVPAIKERVISALAASGVPMLQEAELKGIKPPTTRKPRSA
ncbi:hypothetical protein K438DRAFT_1753660 [Mycena galopus ATCC 62051]|nr:hypothetical protein K438DRAFT_1753660 [Mycena galopus ATCC 62051]